MGILILILCEVIIALCVGLWLLNLSIKRLKEESNNRQKVIDGLWQENKELKEALLKHIITPTDNDKATEEQTITKAEEFDTDDATYNRVLQEWIYGAAEDKKEEGGLDG